MRLIKGVLNVYRWMFIVLMLFATGYTVGCINRFGYLVWAW